MATPTPSPWRRAFRRLLRDKPAVVALGVPPARPPRRGVRAARRAAPPTIASAPPFGTELEHPFGTDDLGRDTLQPDRLRGAVSLRSGFEIVFLALLVAVPIGLLAGFRGGGTDVTLMRVMDGLASFPPLVLALAVVGDPRSRARERDARDHDRGDPGIHPARRARRRSRCARRRSSRRRSRWGRSRGGSAARACCRTSRRR